MCMTCGIVSLQWEVVHATFMLIRLFAREIVTENLVHESRLRRAHISHAVAVPINYCRDGLVGLVQTELITRRHNRWVRSSRGFPVAAEFLAYHDVNCTECLRINWKESYMLKQLESFVKIGAIHTKIIHIFLVYRNHLIDYSSGVDAPPLFILWYILTRIVRKVFTHFTTGRKWNSKTNWLGLFSSSPAKK